MDARATSALVATDSYAKRLERILSDPGALQTICDHIAMGGTLPGLCEVWDLRLCDVVSWIGAFAFRSARYDKALEARSEWAQETIYNELIHIASFRLTDIIDDFGRPLPKDKWNESAKKSINRFRYEETIDAEGTRKTKLDVGQFDKIKAIELLGKHFGMFIEKHELEAGASLAELILQSTQAKTEEQED